MCCFLLYYFTVVTSELSEEWAQPGVHCMLGKHSLGFSLVDTVARAGMLSPTPSPSKMLMLAYDNSAHSVPLDDRTWRWAGKREHSHTSFWKVSLLLPPFTLTKMSEH